MGDSIAQMASPTGDEPRRVHRRHPVWWTLTIIGTAGVAVLP